MQVGVLGYRSLPDTHSLFSVDSLNELDQLEHTVGEKSTTMDAVVLVPDGKKWKLRKVGDGNRCLFSDHEFTCHALVL